MIDGTPISSRLYHIGHPRLGRYGPELLILKLRTFDKGKYETSNAGTHNVDFTSTYQSEVLRFSIHPASFEPGRVA
jgi:hypothetical protein